MERLRIVAVVALAVAGLVTGANAAGQKQDEPASTSLAIEVANLNGSPAYLPVPGGGSTNFRRIPSWQPPDPSLKLIDVRLGTRMEGQAVRVTVAAFWGPRYDDKMETVATYLIRENEKVVVRELERIGVVPYELTIVRVKPFAQRLPTVLNKTRSIEVIGIQPKAMTFPASRLSLRNVSDKKVTGLQIDLLQDNKKPAVGMPQQRGCKQPLIDAGATYEIDIHHTVTNPSDNRGRKTPEGYVPEFLPYVVITTVMFEDGTYEGDHVNAAAFRASERACKMQLEQVLRLLQSALEGSDQDAPEVIGRLKAQASSLGEDVGMAEVAEVLIEFPPFDQETRKSFYPSLEDWIKRNMDGTLHSLKRALLGKIGRFEQTGELARGSTTLHQWLSQIKQEYEKLYSRL